MSIRDGPFDDLKVPMTWTAAAAVAVAAVIALALLLGDRRERVDQPTYPPSRAVFDAVAAGTGEILATPVRWTRGGYDHVVSYFYAIDENRRLRREMAEMRRWRDAALALRDRNARYEALLKLRTDPPIEMVSAHAVAESRGPFAKSRLMNSGATSGVRVGNPVMSENGLVGRVVGVSPEVSRVLLLTDPASRTPVMVERSNARAILVGDGGPNPRMEFLRGQAAVQAGDRVVTSGDGGVFPRGLPVGAAVKGMDGTWRLRLYSDRAPIDFVRILLFRDFAANADQAALSRSVMPPAPSGPAVQPPPAAAAPPAAAPAVPTRPTAAPSTAAAAPSRSPSARTTGAAAPPRARASPVDSPASPTPEPAAAPPAAAPPSVPPADPAPAPAEGPTP